MPTVPNTFLKVVNRAKSANDPARPKMNARKPVKRANAPAIKNATSKAIAVSAQ
jgi:hypothetical protein